MINVLLPSMDELRAKYEANEKSGDLPAGTAFHIEVAFYYGWLAAVETMQTANLLARPWNETLDKMRDIANTSMAEEIGG